MSIITDSMVSFFIDKGANIFIKGVKDQYQLEKIKQEIRSYAQRYFETCFYNISLSQEFDFAGLNNFLFDNIDNAIAPCFNAPYNKDKSFFNEQLLKKVYVHAKADSREKKNMVYAYVQGILAIIRNQFIESIDDNEWFLAGRIVEDVQEITTNLIKEYSSQIKDYIRYYGSFADAIDSIIPQLDIDNEYHFLRKNIYFQGRENDLAYLDNFLAASPELLFAVITGQGGIGKSKLMHHYRLREMGNSEWKIVFPNHNQISLFANEHEWNYPKNLLVIIDYAGELPEVVGKWIDLLASTKKRPLKMRIVMLERQGVVNTGNEINSYPYWYLQIKQAAGYNFDTLLYGQRFYNLEPLTHEDLFSLMDNIADNREKSISQDGKKAILKQAYMMEEAKNTKRFVTPLIIILLTDAFLEGETLGKFNSIKLMEHIIKKHRNRWLKTICKEDRALFNSLEMLIVYATATGGWDLTPLPEPFFKISADWLNSHNKTNLLLILSDVQENAAQISQLSPLEPDIVGEYFVLWFLKEYALNTNYNDLLKLLWSTRIKFTYFLSRCIHSFLCDNEFNQLVDGKHSLFIECDSMYYQSILLVNLSAQLPQGRCKNIVNRLAMVAQDDRYSDNQDIVLTYANGLVNLSNKQDAKDGAATIARLEALAKDDRYSDNQDIVLTYAQGLVNLSNKQDAKDGAATIARLEALAKDDRYSDNQDIVLEYAHGLFNLSNKQDAKDGAATIARLEALAKDGRYSDNQDIVLTYAKGLFNLSNKHDTKDRAAIIARLEALAKDDRYSDNQDIVLEYAKGLVNLSNEQDAKDGAATIARLEALAKDGRYSDNQDIVLTYAQGLVNLSNKQDAKDGAATIARLEALAKDDRYSDNQDIVLEYAHGLFNLSNKQDAKDGAATIARLEALAKDGRYSDNQDIVLTYAKGLFNLSNKHDTKDRAATIARLEALAKDGRYSDNQDIVLEYAKGLFNLSNKQDTKDRAATIARLEALVKDDRYSDNQDIVLEYAHGLFNLSNKQDAKEGAATIARLEALAKDDRYSDNQDIVLTYAHGLVNLSNKQDAKDGAATIARLEALAKDDRYSDNQDIVLEYTKGLFNLSNKQDTKDRAATIARLEALAKEQYEP